MHDGHWSLKPLSARLAQDCHVGDLEGDIIPQRRHERATERRIWRRRSGHGWLVVKIRLICATILLINQLERQL